VACMYAKLPQKDQIPRIIRKCVDGVHIMQRFLF
jgi:hypothetical protein